MPLSGHPGSYHLGLLTNRANCTFEEAVKYIGSVDIDQVFPPSKNAINSNGSTVAVIRFPLFDLTTYISLNLPIQGGLTLIAFKF